MAETSEVGQIVILNGIPRSGKSSIVEVIQETFDGIWMNMGVDTFKEHMTPKRLNPGLGLRPGGERQDIEPLVPLFYAAMYDCIAALSQLGLNVVVDVGHHDGYAIRRGILFDAARRLDGFPVVFVGIRCPVEIVWERRKNTWHTEEGIPDDAPIPDTIHRWEREVHHPGIYDLEVDTSLLSPEGCSQEIRKFLENGPPPSAFKQLAAMSIKRNIEPS